MKLKALVLLLCIGLFTACSNDDGNDDGNQQVSDANYFPLAVENEWNYDNTSQPEGEPAVESTDELYVSAYTNGQYEMDTQSIANGFMTSLFANGTLSKENYQLRYNGSYLFQFEGINPIEIPLNNVVVYDVSANTGAELFSVSDVFTETVQDIPLQIEYSVFTTQEGNLASREVNGVTYEDVITSRFVLTLKISLEFLGSTLPILDTQDVLVGTNYYAAGVGMIQSDVTFSYNLEDFSQLPVTLPFESTATVNSTQELTSYIVVEED